MARLCGRHGSHGDVVEDDLCDKMSVHLEACLCIRHIRATVDANQKDSLSYTVRILLFPRMGDNISDQMEGRSIFQAQDGAFLRVLSSRTSI